MLDTAIVFIFIVFGIKGFWAGDFRELRGLLSMGTSLLLALIPSKGITSDLLTAGLTLEMARAFAIFIGAVVVYPPVHFGLSLLLDPLNHFGKSLRLQQQCLGAGFSLLKALILVIFLANVLMRAPLASPSLRDSAVLRTFYLYGP